MLINSPRELFVVLLSDLRQGADRTIKIIYEISQMVQDPDIREALEARVFISYNILSTLEQCFKVIGVEQVKVSGRLYEIFTREFRSGLAEIQSPTVRDLFMLAKANQLIYLRISEYKALIAAADLSGHYGVRVLLESCLADKIAFVERTRRLIQSTAEATRVAEIFTARPAA